MAVLVGLCSEEKKKLLSSTNVRLNFSLLKSHSVRDASPPQTFPQDLCARVFPKAFCRQWSPGRRVPPRLSSHASFYDTLKGFSENHTSSLQTRCFRFYSVRTSSFPRVLDSFGEFSKWLHYEASTHPSTVFHHVSGCSGHCCRSVKNAVLSTSLGGVNTLVFIIDFFNFSK